MGNNHFSLRIKVLKHYDNHLHFINNWDVIVEET